jgi:hypothetical protein
VRRERLPGPHRLDRLRPGPLDRVGRDVRDRVGAEAEVGGDPEVAAASATRGPEEVGMLGRVAVDRRPRGGVAPSP